MIVGKKREVESGVRVGQIYIDTRIRRQFRRVTIESIAPPLKKALGNNRKKGHRYTSCRTSDDRVVIIEAESFTKKGSQYRLFKNGREPYATVERDVCESVLQCGCGPHQATEDGGFNSPA